MFKCVREKRLRHTVAVNSLPSWPMNIMVHSVWSHREGLSSEPDIPSLSQEQWRIFPLHQGADQSGMNLNAWNMLNPPSYMRCIWFSLNIVSLYFLASLQSMPSTLLMQYLVSGKPAWQFAWAEKICLKSAFTGGFNILRKMLCFCSLKVCHKHEWNYTLALPHPQSSLPEEKIIHFQLQGQLKSIQRWEKTDHFSYGSNCFH